MKAGSFALLWGCLQDKGALDGSGLGESSAVDDSACSPDITWYGDEDGDRFGDPGKGFEACAPPEGAVAEAGDCNDTNMEVYPGAVEICADGVVNDCEDEDGSRAAEICQGRGPYSLAGADARLVGEQVGDGAGGAVSDAGDTNGDGFSDLLVAAPLADNEIGGTGKIYLVLGPVTGTRELRNADMVVVSDAAIGSALAKGGDMNRDGFGDFWVTGAQSGPTGSGEGAAWLLEGPLEGEQIVSLSEVTFVGAPHEHAGTSVTSVGDVNDDGWEDALVGAPDANGAPLESSAGDCPHGDAEAWGDEGGERAGAAYLLLGPVADSMDPSHASARMVGEDGDDLAGKAVVRGGDLDGDGRADLFLSAYNNCEGGIDAGAAYVQYGTLSGEVTLADVDAKIVGEQSYDRVGQSIAVAGDLNGDGHPDLLVGAPESVNDEYAGKVYILSGPILGVTGIGTAVARFDGDEPYMRSGYALSGLDDTDEDGFADFVVGAPHKGNSEDALSGAVYLLLGPVSGVLTERDAHIEMEGREGDAAGYSVASAEGVVREAPPDVLVSAHGMDDNGEWAGGAYLLLGAGQILIGEGGI